MKDVDVAWSIMLILILIHLDVSSVMSSRLSSCVLELDSDRDLFSTVFHLVCPIRLRMRNTLARL